MEKRTPAEMILNIMENFDFKKVEDTVNALGWKWATGLGYTTPGQEGLRATAQMLLHDVVKLLLTDPRIEPNVACSVATGGLKASGYKSKKGNVVDLELEFVLTSWNTQRKSYE